MKKVYFCFVLFSLLTLGACHNDDSYKQNQPQPQQPTDIRLVLAGRVGTVVGDSLSEYIEALNLLLFRENNAGNYLLYRQKMLTKNELRALANGDIASEAGFTVFKEVTFDTVPVGNYQIVGVGNVLDSTGAAMPNVAFSGLTIGAAMSDVMVTVRDGEESPRLFLGMTNAISAGSDTDALPVMRLYRKVSMFALTLLKIPDVVNRIDMEFEQTDGSFNMQGNYSGNNFVLASKTYTQQVQDSITLNYVMLPTVQGDSTSILATFYLSGGAKQPVTLPKYLLAPNTITKVTATIDPDQSGNAWKVNINSLITVNVEWNVDQEPPIVI